MDLNSYGKPLVLMRFGSHLYGTNTENSDLDIKGVFVPPKADCFWGKVPKSITKNTKKSSTLKNTKEDQDYEEYSLQYFLQLGFKGETVFLDMVHAPDNQLLTSSPEWEFIKKNRSKFYTKNLKSYLGYCRTQAAKYGIKGSRLSDSENVMRFLQSVPPKIVDCPVRTSGIQQVQQRIGDVWDSLPTGEHIKKYILESARSSGDMRCYDVCGKKLMGSTPINEALNVITLFVDNYGNRARLAKLNEGVDWKAISHALRAGYQLKSLYQDGDIVFPLKEADFLKKVKSGQLHYENDGVGEMLENIISEVEELSTNSSYPDTVDQEFWYNWLTQEVYK